jgi:hypothetical protein
MSHGSTWFALVPLVAVGGGMVVGAIAIVTEHRRKQALLEERRLMIEKGMAPPPLTEQLLSAGGEAGTRAAIESSLQTGIVTLFVGLGLIAFSLMLRFVVAADLSFIPQPVIALLAPAGALVSLIGIGNLVYFWIASRRASGAA